MMLKRSVKHPIEKTFAKYGFKRLDFDLMHFNAVQVYESSNY